MPKNPFRKLQTALKRSDKTNPNSDIERQNNLLESFLELVCFQYVSFSLFTKVLQTLYLYATATEVSKIGELGEE